MKRWTKFALVILAGALVVGLLLIATVLVAFDSDDYRRLAIRSVNYFSGYTVTIDGPFKLEISANPSLTAENIQLQAKDDRSPPIAVIGKLSAKIGLPQLILGNLVVKALRVDDAVLAIIISDRDDSGVRADDSPIISGDIDLPVFENVRLRNIRLNVVDAGADRTIAIRLRRFNIDDVRNAGLMFVSGEGTINGQEFDIEGRMGALEAMFRGEKPYPVDYKVNFAGFSFSVAGTFEDYANAQGMNLQISGEVAELADLFALLQIDAPPLGRLTFEAAIADNLSAPRMRFLSVALSGVPQIQFSANGAVANVLTGEGTDIDFAGSCAIAKILRTTKLESLTGLSLARISGKLQETGGVLAAENLKAEVASDEGVAVSAAGRIELGGHVAALKVKSLALELKALYPTSAVLKPLVFERLPEVGPVVAQARLTGSPAFLSLEDLTINAGGYGPLKFSIRGGLAGKLSGDGLTLTGFDLATTIESKTTALLATAYGAKLPELGAVSATFRMSGNLERFRLEQIDLRTETARGLKTAFTGNIAFGRKRDYKLIGKLDIQMGITAPTVGAALAPWDIRYFSVLNNVQATARISGTTEVLAIKDIALRAGDASQMKITLNGKFERNFLSQNRSLSGVRLAATIEADSTAVLSESLGIRLPDSGPLRLEARFTDRQGGIDVETFTITAGTAENIFLAVRGQILQLTDPDRTSLKASFETASQPWVETYLGQKHGRNTSLSGELQADRTEKGIRIDAFRVGTPGKNGMNMQANGTIQDLAGAWQIDLQLNASASDPTLIGSITGLPVPQLAPVAIGGRISGKIPDTVFDGEARVGETILSTHISTTVTAGRPLISGKIASRLVDLNEIGIFRGVSPEEAVAAPKQVPAGVKRLFSNTPLLPFEALRNFDFTLNLNADKLVSRNITIEKLDIDARLKNGQLHINPARLAYSGGFTEMDFSLDESGEVPRFALKIAGEDIDVDDVLAYAHEPIILSGSLNLVADLHSSGASAHAVAANLNGVFSMALENGQILRIVDLLSKDAFDLLLTTADSRTYTDMHCLINKINFNRGIGTIDILYMDSPKIRARGAGTINLADETLDVVINPQRKRAFFNRRSAVRINGSLRNPSAFTMPLAEAAEVYGTIVMPFVFLPLRALGNLWHLLTKDTEQTPCDLVEIK
jgi:uncharacterized protein involved in outer membrane biogenesis